MAVRKSMVRKYPQLRKWLMLVLGLLIALLVGGGVALGALLGYLSTLPRIEMLENYTPPGITRVFDHSGNTEIAQFFEERREIVHLEDIPPHVVQAFIAIEDERFYSHFGVDLPSIIRALKANVESGQKAQGASTITMQVARNVVLQQRQKAWGRKFRELLIALKIEHDYSKRQILEFYLNQIFFGAKAYGIQEASEQYFDKDVKDLTIPEAALLAGLPKAPSELSPYRDKQKALERRNLVLTNMRRLGFIQSDAELERYKRTPIELHPPPRPRELAPYYADYVRSLLMKDNSMENGSQLGEKAYTIVSGVDLRLQQICEEELSKGLRQVETMSEQLKPGRLAEESSSLGGFAARQARLMRIREVKPKSIVVEMSGYHGEIALPETLPYFSSSGALRPGNLIDTYIDEIHGNKIKGSLYDQSHVQGAAVLLNAKTGEILALVGGENFNDTANDGQWNRAVQGGRQPGSSWKPLLYASAFDLNGEGGQPRFTPGSVEMDEPLSVGNWSPKNYENNFQGPMALFEALVESRNVPTVRLFYDIGPKRAVSLYHRFNLVNIPSNWVLPAVGPVALGTANITPLELTSAYLVFANQGLGFHPMAIKHMTSAYDPAEASVSRPEPIRVLSPEAAYMTTRILQDVIRMGTAKESVGKWEAEQLRLGRHLPEIAGKTGTTNDCVVAWFTGFTPELVLGVYVGYDHQRSLGPKMTGSRVVGPIWVAMMDRVLQTRNDWQLTFDVPSGVDFRDICSKSGKLVTASCLASGDHVFAHVAFKHGSAPTQTCDFHGGGSYAPLSPAAPPTQAAPASHTRSTSLSATSPR